MIRNLAMTLLLACAAVANATEPCPTNTKQEEYDCLREHYVNGLPVSPAMDLADRARELRGNERYKILDEQAKAVDLLCQDDVKCYQSMRDQGTPLSFDGRLKALKQDVETRTRKFTTIDEAWGDGPVKSVETPAEAVAELASEENVQEYLTNVSPNLRYIFETARTALPTLDQTSVAAKDLAELVMQQIVMLGVAGLIWHICWIVFPILVAVILRTHLEKQAVARELTAREIHENAKSSFDRDKLVNYHLEDVGFLRFIGFIALIICLAIAALSGAGMFEPLSQTLAPGAWLVTEMIR